ncbi:hypothetical protein [Mycoplasma sp. 4423]
MSKLAEIKLQEQEQESISLKQKNYIEKCIKIARSRYGKFDKYKKLNWLMIANYILENRFSLTGSKSNFKKLNGMLGVVYVLMRIRLKDNLNKFYSKVQWTSWLMTFGFKRSTSFELLAKLAKLGLANLDHPYLTIFGEYAMLWVIKGIKGSKKTKNYILRTKELIEFLCFGYKQLQTSLFINLTLRKFKTLSKLKVKVKDKVKKLQVFNNQVFINLQIANSKTTIKKMLEKYTLMHYNQSYKNFFVTLRIKIDSVFTSYRVIRNSLY